MNPTLLDHKELTSGSTNIRSATVAPTAGRFVGMVCLTRLGSSHTHTPVDTFGGGGSTAITWTNITGQATVGATRIRLSFAWGWVPASPGSHEFGFDFSSTVSRRILLVYEWPAGVDPTTPVRQSITGLGTTSTTPSLSLTSAALTANDVWGVFGCDGVTDIAAGDGGGGGGAAFTQYGLEYATAAGSSDINVFLEKRAGNTGQTVNASNLGVVNNIALAFEINAAASSSALLAMLLNQ